MYVSIMIVIASLMIAVSIMMAVTDGGIDCHVVYTDVDCDHPAEHHNYCPCAAGVSADRECQDDDDDDGYRHGDDRNDGDGNA